MTTTIPAYTFGGITRPELILDDQGRIVLFGAAADFAATYGLKALYAGCPPGTPYPPVLDSLLAPNDTNGAPNTVAEGAASGTSVGITAHTISPIGPVTYSLVGDSSGGGFKINATTGVVTVNDATKIDFESAPGHQYTITVQSSDLIITTTKTFTIAVTDVAPSAPADTNAGANTVAEGAAAGTAVGITAHSTDINGGALTYSLTGDTSGGGFKIDATTGVITVADPTKIDFESTAPGHTYTVTAQASDGTLSSSQTFTIGVTDVTIGVPVDANAAANSVVEGAANGSTVGLTASAVDPNGPPTSYALIGDTSGGGFTINATTGVVTVADHTKVDFESAAGHAYSVTVQATNGATVTSQSFTIGVTDVAPSTPIDGDPAFNTVAEGAFGPVGITALSTDVNGPGVTWSLTADSSNGGFSINPTTGVISVANPAKVDYETAAGHAYTVTAQASDGTLTGSQTFTIAVTDVAPSTPIDSNANGNFVTEGAANGTAVGITASSSDINGPAVTYSLIGDTSNGGFTINAATGVVTVADSTKIDYESSAIAGHSYLINVQASDGTLTSSQGFSIAVNNAPPSQPVDNDAAANSVAEGAAINTTVGVTASSTDVNGGQVTYILGLDSSGGGFKVDATTGVISVADPSKLNYETAPGHAYTVSVVPTDGTNPGIGQTFTIAVTDVAPTTPVDSDGAANTVVEGAANGSTVGVTASSTDVNGPAVTYSLTGDTSGGGFFIDPSTGVVHVLDSTKIDFETSGVAHTYTITAQASDGTLASSQTFTIGVTDTPPSVPVDSDAAANSVAEGAAAGSTVGVTASSTDVNGPPVTYSLTGDASGGGFTINATTGVVTVADPSKIDFESTAPGHSYTVTAQASDGTDASSQIFTIGVTDVAPSTPVDADAAANTIVEGGANGSTVGVTASSTDVNGPAVTYSLIGDTSGGGFTINATTGVVTVADNTKIDFESSGAGHNYTVTAQASDGTDTSSQTFTIDVSDVAPSTPVDSNAAINQVSQGAPVGTTVGVTASSTDVNGPAVTYSLVGDTSGGGFTINAATGVVTVADSSKIIFNAGSPSYDVTVDSSDGTLHAQQIFTINVIQNTPPVANDDSLSATEAGGLNNSIPGSDPSGNVILATGSAGAVQDTDAQDASSALTVVAVHTGPEGASVLTGTVNSPLTGDHGTLTLHTDGSYTYAVNQTDAAVQALATSAETITDKYNYTIQDTGGLQDTASITFTIHGADDLPQAVADTGTMTEDDAPISFNVIANDTQDPDHTAANTIAVGPGGVTVTGPAGETFVNTDATASIVSNQVQVTLNNAHFQQLAVGESATVTVPYTLTGDVGETSSANLVVTVNGVNDVPVAVDDSGSMTEDQSGHAFTVLTNDTLDADHGAPNNVTTGTVTNLAAPSGENIDTTDISLSVNGSNQIVVNLGSDFQHMQDGQSTTFDIPYTLHGDQAGDTSSATLHVTVTGVNDAPTAGNFTFNGVNSATGNTDLVVNDPTDGAPDPAGPQKTITASLLSGASDVDGPGPLIVVAGNLATAHGGSVTMQSDGDFTYKPPVGYTGSDSFNYQVSDQNAGASGVGLGTGTVTINVAAPNVWYVNADAATDGDGSSENPFNNLSHFNGVAGVDHAGDTIFLETASNHYTAPAGGLQLENNEQLISQSAGLVVPDGGAGTVTLVSQSGANAVVDGGVILGSGNNIQGVNFGTSTTFALSGNNVGTVHVNDLTNGTINNSGGGAVSITGSGNAVNMDFTSLTSGAGTNGVVINGASGTFHAHGGTISGASGADVSLSSGTLNFTDDGAISDSTGTVVSISNMTAGTQSFTGTIGTTVSTDGAISLSSNTGATMNFSGGMALSTSTSNAFSASGGGTVNVTGTNHLTTTTGTALNVANTTIGTSGLTFHDISANGAANGIVLNNTGTNAGLTVTGSGNATQGGDSSGGIIQGTTGDAISLTSTLNPSFTNMNIHNNAGSGIHGTTVTGFTFDNGTLNTNGDNSSGGTEETNIRFDNLLGSGSIDNSSISGGFADNVLVMNDTGTLNRLSITNNAFGLISATSGNDNIHTEVTNSATLNETISNNTFAGTRGDFINPIANLNSTMDVVIRDNTFHNGQTIIPGGGTAVAIQSGSGGETSAATTTFDISHNTLTDGGANAFDTAGIFVAKGQDNGTVSGTIASNAIGPAKANTNADGIFVRSAGTGTDTVLIQNNTITGYGNAGIHLQNNDGSSTMNASIFGNTESSPNSQNFSGLFVDNGATATDTSTMNVVVGSSNAGETAKQNTFHGNVIDVSLSNFNASTHFNLSKNGSASATPDGVIQDDNVGAPTVDTSGGAGPITLVNTVPALPPAVAPMLAAPGGVQASSPTPGETHLTQAELDSVVTAAIAEWAHAGASASQLAELQATTFSVADLSSGTIGEESSPAHITIDVNADGHGWFVDPTPADNSEFSHPQNAAGTDLLTDPSNAAAGHLDLLTTVTHEMGHVLGLPDETAPSDAHDLMYINLVDGERRLPDATDVAKATASASAPIVPAWTDHLSPSPGGGDNFNFTPPATLTTTAVPQLGGGAVIDAIKGILDHVGPGVFDHLQDAFPWLNTAGETILHDLSPPVGTTLVNLFANGFDWPAQGTTPAPDTHTSVVDTTVHDIAPPIGSILPDLHVLAATLPSIGGYIVH
ncbi:MAG TPA: cadherin domain-containing protein [Bradyrhizobium sp.]